MEETQIETQNLSEQTQEPEVYENSADVYDEEPEVQDFQEGESLGQDPSADLILGKFKSVEDLSKAYQELERRQGLSSAELGALRRNVSELQAAKNLFGGLVIFLDKPFNVGDWIEMDPYEGTIEDITFRTTRIRTFENSILNVPNSKIADSAVINWSKMEQRRYKVNLRIELGTPVEKLQKLKERVEKMLHERESILDDQTIVRYDNIDENGINMLIYTYTDSVGYDSYLAEVEDINYKLMKILEEENVKVAYDTQNVYVKN